MVIISLPNGSDWFKANWVFRQLAKDVVAVYPADPYLEYRFQIGEAIGHLNLGPGDRISSAYVITKLKAVLERIVAADIPHWEGDQPGDDDDRNLYIGAMRDLLTLVNEQDT